MTDISPKIEVGVWIVRQDGSYGYDVHLVTFVTAATVGLANREGRYTPKRIQKQDVRYAGSETECRLACERMVSSKSLAASEKVKADDRHRARVAKISNIVRATGEAS